MLPVTALLCGHPVPSRVHTAIPCHAAQPILGISTSSQACNALFVYEPLEGSCCATKAKGHWVCLLWAPYSIMSQALPSVMTLYSKYAHWY